MARCKRTGCGSHAINEFPESGYCDRCYWFAEAERLGVALARVVGLGRSEDCLFCGFKDGCAVEALKEVNSDL